MNTQQPRPVSPNGFALIELITALFIVTVGLFGVMQMYLKTMESNRQIEMYAAATQILQGEMERIQADAGARLVLGSQVLECTHPLLERLHKAELVAEVSPVPEGPEGLREVRLGLRWQEYTGRMVEKALLCRMRTKEVAS